jgi:hypothetical protein
MSYDRIIGDSVIWIQVSQNFDSDLLFNRTCRLAGDYKIIIRTLKQFPGL